MKRPWHLTRLGAGLWLFEPGEGLDPGAAGDTIEAVSAALLQDRATCLYYDARAVAVIDPLYWAWLRQLARACALLGASFVLVHVRPETAYALSRHCPPPPFACAGSVPGSAPR